MPRHKKPASVDIAAANYVSGYGLLTRHPMFAPLAAHAGFNRDTAHNRCPSDGWAVVTAGGAIDIHPTRRADPQEWLYVLAHCLLHLGFGHFRKTDHPREWAAACDAYIARFLSDLKLGKPVMELFGPIVLPASTEEGIYQRFCEDGIPSHLQRLGVGSPGGIDIHIDQARPARWDRPANWTRYLGTGLAAAVTSAVNVAAGAEPHLGAITRLHTPAQQARAWFISSFPLLGALAASFDIIEDPLLCHRLDISVAAVDAESQEIYMNPAAGMDEFECRFVMAHELLHVGLQHLARQQGRDHFLWNVACDFVINGWLVEMGVGELPSLGVLYDPTLKGLSAEAIYDRMVVDMRRYRKLCTLRGHGIGDILNRGFRKGDGEITDLDEFYRRCMGQGLCYHNDQSRGFLPAGLVEEIRALSQPPIPWDVELAKWFDSHFSPLEKIRSYARPSRRQSSTPDIPRPRWTPEPGAQDGRTYGVILDTSGSMDRDLLAKGLGTIASYSIARDVERVRVVFCDAVAYDEGYLPPEAVAQKVKVKGRGGTILQPGIDLLERAEDFPKAGPLLIITDGFCDRLRIRRDHAFLMPQNRHLPFVPKGPVFRMKK